jgi:exonuclease SbcD
MRTFRFIHAADIHLDSPLRGLARYEGLPTAEIRQASRTAFDNLIRFACIERVDFMVIAGDLYDGDWKDMSTGLYFAAAMGKLGAAGIPVFLIRGNHDASSVLTRSLPLPSNVRVFSDRSGETFRIEEIGVAIHGRSFGAKKETEDITPSYPPAEAGLFNIGLLHTSLSGYAAHETYAPCNLAALDSKGYDYWALGHVHDFAILSTNPHVVFSGVLQGRHSREVGPKGAVLVEVVDGDVRDVTLIQLDVFRWALMELKCEEVRDFDELHALLRQNFSRLLDDLGRDRPLIVRLTLTGHTDFHLHLLDQSSRVRDDVRAIACEVSTDFWIEKIVIETKPAASTTSALASGPLSEALGSAASDEELARRLQSELAPFLSAHLKPSDGLEDTMTALARSSQWTELIAEASTALQARLVDGEAQ